MSLPRILVIDDVYGRIPLETCNPERDQICRSLGIRDVTDDTATKHTKVTVGKPVAEAVFCRGQSTVIDGKRVIVRNSIDTAIAAVERGWNVECDETRWALILLDLTFEEGIVESTGDLPVADQSKFDDSDSWFGLTLLKEIRKRFQDIPVAMLSGNSQEEVDRIFTEHRAVDFLPKGTANQNDLANLIRLNALIPDFTGGIVGRSVALLQCLRHARQVAGSSLPVLIRGDEGTGKTLLAHYIHTQSGRFAQPWEVINAAAIVETLAESEYFGHERGAFDGARALKHGFFERGDKGTVFLDEIGDCPAEIQPKLLRAVQEKKIRRVGGTVDIDVDFRLISATNRNIEQGVAGFRSDLMNRLRKGGTIEIPSLSSRREDIPILVEKFLTSAVSELKARPRTFKPSALDRLSDYDWPGNVRELESVISNVVLKHQRKNFVEADDLEFGTTSSKQFLRSENSDNRESTAFLLPDLVNAMRKTVFPENDNKSWLQGLQILETEFNKLKGRLLSAAIGNKRKNQTTDNPQGEVVDFQPAFKLLIDEASGQFPSGTKYIDKNITREIVKILKSLPSGFELDKNLSELKRLLEKENESDSVPNEDVRSGSGGSVQ